MEHVTDGIYTYGRTKESHDNLVKSIQDWKKSKWERDGAFRKHCELLETCSKRRFLEKLDAYLYKFNPDKGEETSGFLQRLCKLEDFMKSS